MRRYAVVALTNLTFGNATIKSYLCSFPGFVDTMVGQLDTSGWENLRKATAHLFRNLAWKADKSSKLVLSESRVVSVLMEAAMAVSSRALTETPAGLAVEPGREEPTLKVILSALWNLSAHCKKNKADVCSIPGSLVFLVQLLRSRSTAVVENGGGILRNVSSYIATCQQGEEYRAVLRSERCLALLLSQLRSPSLTIVSNACGTLWNFSARSAQDQEELWELGAVPMLQSLTNSKHNTISTCSLAALKNLYTARPAGLFMMVSGAGGAGQLTARKVKNLVADLDEKLSDCGPRDVEGGSPHSSPPASDQDDSGSEKEEEGKNMRGDERKREGSQGSHSPECGRKNLFLAGISEVAKQAGIAPGDLGAALPSCYQQQQQQAQSMEERHSSSYSQPRRSGETRSLSEGRFDGQFVSYMKQPSREVSPQEQEQVEDEGELVGRVNLSPTSLLLSPSSTPLDLTTKRGVEVASLEAVEVEEQPTDYSLRYQESEEPDLEKSDKPELNCDDALRTYCTEGTPMDTPFAFSTATSMSDLREPAIQEEEEEGEEGEIEGDGGDEDREERGEEEKEVTVQYAVEGTPLAFSRAESLSDLEEVEVGEGEGAKLQAIPETGEEKGMAETEGEKRECEGGIKTPPAPHLPKTVKFCGAAEVRSAPQETPLMFSRASSVASLDSFDHDGSLQDGYSSYEASRATSGRVSPSDLPDSPSQTMPTSPRPGGSRLPPRPAKTPSVPPLAPAHQKSVYADVVMSFQEEGTPAVFSTRTSLSGLDFEEEKVKADEGSAKSSNTTMSEDEDIYADSESLLGQLITSAMPESKPAPRSRLPKPRQAWPPLPGTAKTPVRAKAESKADPNASDDSSCSLDQQDLLADCIASAMPVAATRLGPRQAAEGAPAPEPKQGKKTRSQPSLPSRVPPTPPERKGSHLSHPCVAAAAASQDDFRRGGDSMRCWGAVEDTPQHFSAATSLSDLTVDEPASGRHSAAARRRVQHAQQGQQSGKETPLRFMTEDTPAVFSRNDSLSSLEYETEERKGNEVQMGAGLAFLFNSKSFQ